MSSRARDAIACGALAAFSGAVMGALILTVAGFSGFPASFAGGLGDVAALSWYGFVLALPVVLLYGMPLYSLLNRLGFVNPFVAVLSGAFPGVIWVIWTKGTWTDPVLCDGLLIGVIYFSLRRWHNKAGAP